MFIKMIIHDECIEVTIHETEVINRNMGIIYLEELFYHPDREVPATTLYYTYKLSYIDVKVSREEEQDLLYSGSTNLLMFESYRDYDIIHVYRRVKQLLEEAIEKHDPVQIAYYQERKKKIEKEILSMDPLKVDDLIVSANRSVRQAIKYDLANIKIKSPQFYDYIMKTVTFGTVLKYEPDKARDIDLILRIK